MYKFFSSPYTNTPAQIALRGLRGESSLKGVKAEYEDELKARDLVPFYVALNVINSLIHIITEGIK